MPTSFSVFYLGVTPEIDTTEGDQVSENHLALEGLTFGGASDPLAYDLEAFSPGSFAGGDPAVYDADNAVANDTFRINGGTLRTHDATMIYSGTRITYTDGSSVFVDAIVMQDTDGNLYLLPPTAGPNAYSDALQDRPIESVTLGTAVPANGTDAYQMASDRYQLTIPDYTVEGTAGNDLINGAYAGDPEGDDVDNTDGIDGSNDDLIETYGGADTVLAGLGDDTVDGGTGNDTLFGEAGNDVLIGGEGNDSLDGDDGNDSLSGGAGYDIIIGDAGDDTAWGGAGDDQFYDATGANLFYGGDGNDAGFGGADSDTISGEVGQDTIVGNAGDDSLYGGSGSDSITGGDGNDSIRGDGQWVDRNDYLSGGGSATDLTVVNLADAPIELWWIDGAGTLQYYATIQPGQTVVQPTFTEHNWLLRGEDGFHLQVIEGGESQTVTFGPDLGDDLSGGAGNDTLYGQYGSDTIDGGAGDDQLFGGTGNDSLTGGAGADLLDGGAGDDSFILTSGDTATGGDGDDVFNISRDDLTGGTLSVDGGEGAETAGDTLNIIGPAEIVFDDGNPEAGTATWLDGTTLTFTNIESVNYVPCFTADSLIKTLRGEVRAADIRRGDMVLTRDAGYQPVRWTGQRHLTLTQLRANPQLRPVTIVAGALGKNQPERDLMVSPQHRLLVGNSDTQLWLGIDEALATALHLTCLPGVRQAMPKAGVTYVHLMFDHHQIICGDGAWSESFQPGAFVLAHMGQAQRDELFAIFPELRAQRSDERYPAARVTLKAHEARILALH